MDRTLTKQMALLLLGRSASLVFSFGLPLVLARIFSAEEFGIYKQLFLIYVTLLGILTFGFSASLYYFVPGRPTREQQAFIAQAVLVLAVLGTGGAAGLLAFPEEISAAFNAPSLGQYLPYMAAFTVLALVASLLETLMIVLKQPELASLTNFSSELCRAVTMTVAAVLTHSLLAVIIASLLWAAARATVLLTYLRKLGVAWWRLPDRARFLEQLRFAMPFGVAMIAWTLVQNLHHYAVAALYDPAVYAIYAVGCLQIPALGIVFETVSDLTLVRITELRQENRLEEAVSLMGASVTKLALILLPVFAWFQLHAREVLLLLYTERFEASVDIFRVFLASLVLAVLELDYIARAFGDSRFILKINLLHLTFSALLLLSLIEPLGPRGAAVAAVAATALAKIFTLSKLRMLFETPVRRLLPWGQLAKIAGMAAVAAAAAALAPLLVSGTAARLLLSILLFASVYGALVWFNDVLDEGDRHWVRRSSRRLAEAMLLLKPQTAADR